MKIKVPLAIIILIALPLTSSQKCSTFTIQNQSVVNLGTVQIQGSGGSDNVDVLAHSIYNETICFDANAVDVAGTIVSYPIGATIITANGAVDVGWTSSSIVEIIDHDVMNAPAQ